MEKPEILKKESKEMQDIISKSDVDRAVFEIYGKSGWESFNEEYKEHPDWKLEKVLEEFEIHPVNIQTSFFRVGNLKGIAQEIVPKIERKENDKKVQILEIGSSAGYETYSLAVEMFEAGHDDFSITAVDVNIDMLAKAEAGEYELWEPIDRVDSGYSKLKSEHFKKGYFEDSGKTWEYKVYAGPSLSEVMRNPKYYNSFKKELIRKNIPPSWYRVEPMPIVRPTKKIREKINFVLQDIIDKPVEGKYEVALINNVLNHYPDRTREKILKNVIASLKPGGYVVLEHTMNPLNDEEEKWLNPYNEWRASFAEKFGLKEVGVKTWWSEGKEEFVGQYYQYQG